MDRIQKRHQMIPIGVVLGVAIFLLLCVSAGLAAAMIDDEQNKPDNLA